MSVALVTDSTAYLPVELVAGASAHLRVVPLHVVLGGVERREGVDVSVQDLSDALRSFTPVSTSRPSPQELLLAYEGAAEKGATEVVSVHLSSAMSGTYESAVLAAQQSPVPVQVVDSRSLGMAMGFAVLSAVDAAAEGRPAVEVAEIASRRARSAMVAFYVDTLEYLRRGGRIGAASAMLGSALAIKPILGLVDGAIRPLERVRTSGRALARLADLTAAAAAQMQTGGAVVDIAVQHLDSAGRAHALAVTLREQVPEVGHLVVAELGAVVGAHVGPGTLAVVASPRPH